MTAEPSTRQLAENPYHDRIEGDVLTFTASGREGDQTVGGVNARLVQQPTYEFPIYGFVLMGSRRKLGPKRWVFLGLLEYLRHYPESQRDSTGQNRVAWVFELRIHGQLAGISVANDSSISKQLLAESKSTECLTGDDREIVSEHEPKNRTECENRDTIETIRTRLLGYSPREFELILRLVLSRTGFSRVEVTRYSQDGGIDITALTDGHLWPIRNLQVQVQAKRWIHTVGRKEVAELRGSLSPHARGCIVTTSHYSRAALAESSEGGKVPITLVNGYEIAEIITTAGIELPTSPT